LSLFTHSSYFKNLRFSRILIAFPEPAAPFFLQALVDGLHAADNKGVLGVIISLTSFHKRVNSQSFFDITNVFPVGGESGTQVRSRQHGESWKRRKPEAARGSARVYQQAAGRGEHEMFRGKNRSPEALTDLPGWW